MEQTANESQAIPAYDVRLTKLEKAVADLQCEQVLLRQQMESGFAAIQAQFALTEEKLRREFQEGLHALEQRLNAKIEAESRRLEEKFSSQLGGEIQLLVARLDRQDARIDRLDAKIDQLAKWLIGAQVTTLALVAAIAVKVFLL